MTNGLKAIGTLEYQPMSCNLLLFGITMKISYDSLNAFLGPSPRLMKMMKSKDTETGKNRLYNEVRRNCVGVAQNVPTPQHETQRQTHPGKSKTSTCSSFMVISSLTSTVSLKFQSLFSGRLSSPLSESMISCLIDRFSPRESIPSSST